MLLSINRLWLHQPEWPKFIGLFVVQVQLRSDKTRVLFDNVSYFVVICKFAATFFQMDDDFCALLHALCFGNVVCTCRHTMGKVFEFWLMSNLKKMKSRNVNLGAIFFFPFLHRNKNIATVCHSV